MKKVLESEQIIFIFFFYLYPQFKFPMQMYAVLELHIMPSLYCDAPLDTPHDVISH